METRTDYRINTRAFRHPRLSDIGRWWPGHHNMHIPGGSAAIPRGPLSVATPMPHLVSPTNIPHYGAHIVEPAEQLLSLLCVDEQSIRLDCEAQWLSRLLICGVHLADDVEVAELGYLEDAIIPDPPLPLGPEQAVLLEPFLAERRTAKGLCVGFGQIPLDEPAVADMLAEAKRPDFTPHYGEIHALGEFKGRLIDVLAAQPGTRTTTVLDPRIQQYSESRSGGWGGMHYDNALTKDGAGERFAIGVRVETADRRVLYNTGPGPRHLVVALNMTAVHLSDRVKPGDAGYVPDSSQLRTFLHDNPAEVGKIVCVVVTLAPGEYVLFPAGVAIHDGSMYGCPDVSHAIVLGGKFPRRDVFEDEAVAVDSVREFA